MAPLYSTSRQVASARAHVPTAIPISATRELSMPFKIGSGSLIFHEASRAPCLHLWDGRGGERGLEHAVAAPLAEPRTSLKPDPDADCACASGGSGSLPAPLREQVVCRAKQNELNRALAPRAEDKFPRTHPPQS